MDALLPMRDPLTLMSLSARYSTFMQAQAHVHEIERHLSYYRTGSGIDVGSPAVMTPSLLARRSMRSWLGHDRDYNRTHVGSCLVVLPPSASLIEVAMRPVATKLISQPNKSVPLRASLFTTATPLPRVSVWAPLGRSNCLVLRTTTILSRRPGSTVSSSVHDLRKGGLQFSVLGLFTIQLGSITNTTENALQP